MGHQSAQQLLDLHASLYQKAYASAQAFPSVSSSRLKEYSSNFQKMLPDLHWSIAEEDMIVRALRADHFLYGDFHTLRQAQRGFLRFLRALLPRLQGRREIVLALEMFSTTQQKELDAFMSRKLSEDEFKDAISYDKTWGFSWRNYAPIVEFARVHDIKTYAVNTPKKRNRLTLKERDTAIAKRLEEIRDNHPEALIITMIGEYHLADEHLPRQILQVSQERHQKPDIVRLLNNIDRYYFDLLRAGQAPTQSEFLKLRDDLFCLINTPAWMKWRSLANWEELSSIGGTSSHDFNSDGDEEHDGHGPDLDHQFLELVTHLCKFLGMEHDSSALQNFHIVHAFTAELTSKLKRKHAKLDRDIASLIEKAEVEGACFVAEESTLVLRNLSLNSLAKLAGEFLQSSSSRAVLKKASSQQRFFQSILSHAAAEASVSLLNPRRKSSAQGSIPDSLMRTYAPRTSSERKRFTESIKQICDQLDHLHKSLTGNNLEPAQNYKALLSFDERNGRVLSKTLGENLGSDLARRLLSNEIALQDLSMLYRDFRNAMPDLARLYAQLMALSVPQQTRITA